MREFLRGALGPRGDALELASWEESDSTNKVFEREWASARAAPGTGVFSIEGTCRSTVLAYIAERRRDLPMHEELLLFLPNWYACGAVKIDIGEALVAAAKYGARHVSPHWREVRFGAKYGARHVSPHWREVRFGEKTCLAPYFAL